MTPVLVTVLVALLLALKVDLTFVELGGLVAAAVIAAALPRLGEARFRRLRCACERISRRRRLAILIAALAAPALRIALLPVLPVPEPKVTDEYSHLLLGDTLAHGRLTNPTHPMWRHFETIHVLQRPTYNSMYFPGQGAFLALGKLLTGSPWAGVVLSVALMSGAICWMLQAWVPPGWALFGAVLAALRLGLISYWMNSYWGGALAAMGGALVLGALPRIRRHMRFRDVLLMGAGTAALAVSRPYEGLALCVPVAGSLAVWLLRRRAFARVALPLGAMAVAGFALLGFYFWRVTGDPFRLPYEVNQRTYGWPMTLAWQTPKAISQPYEDMRRYFQWELGEHVRLLAPGIDTHLTAAEAVWIWSFFFGIALSLPLVLFPRAFTGRRIRLPLIAGACVAVAAVFEQSRYPHYLAPAASVAALLWVQGLRHCRTAMPAFARLIPAVVVLAVVWRGVAGDAAVAYGKARNPVSWCCGGAGDVDRARIIRKLEAAGGKHLVLVRYKLSHDWVESWINNAADIDGARIVWARDLGASNGPLLDYFRGRTVWLLRADEKPLELTPL